jgi:hypothetical protein
MGITLPEMRGVRKLFLSHKGSFRLELRIVLPGGWFMMKMKGIFAGLLLLACSARVPGQNAKTTEDLTVAQVFNRDLTGAEKEFVSAAEAMPEDKYSFAPTNGEFKGVRNFGQQVKHVAAVNCLIGAIILQEKPPVDAGGENGPDSVKSKAEIVKYLKESFTYVHKAFGTINTSNLVTPIKPPWGETMATRQGMATIATGHCFDHYGQVVHPTSKITSRLHDSVR